MSVGAQYTQFGTANAQSETSLGAKKGLTLLPDINIVMDVVLMRAYRSASCQQSCVALCLLHKNSHKSQTEENIATATGKSTRISCIMYLVMERKLRKSL
jgi:hypothetical protein